MVVGHPIHAGPRRTICASCHKKHGALGTYWLRGGHGGRNVECRSQVPAALRPAVVEQTVVQWMIVGVAH
jgi:hypothetical protein